MKSLALLWFISSLSSFTGFSPDEANRLQNAANNYPFTLKAETGDFANRHSLEDAAHDCVQGPNDVCVVVDPAHHWVSVHFGNATGVPQGDFNVISSAGNPSFKQKDFAGGVIAIANRTLASAKQAQTTSTVVPSTSASVNTPTEEGGHGWLVFFSFLAVLAVGYWVYRLSKRQKNLDEDMSSFREERNEYLNKNVDNLLKTDAIKSDTARKASTSSPTSFRPAAPAPVTVIHNNSNNDMLTGVLLGQAMSHPAPTMSTVIVEREEPRHHHSSSDDSSSSWGSSSSSDSGSSWSSSDSGGGSSDFGGGGGGFDSGGGGSDF